jgi:acetolactate synthase-1/2/3 large subunit
LEALNVPVVNSLMAVDFLPAGHPLRFGLIGSYANRWANHALGRSDFLLVLGSRLDVRQTGADTAAFKSGRVIFHVDCDAAEVNNRVKGCRAVRAELGAFFEEFEGAVPQALPARPQWLQELQALRARWPDVAEAGKIRGINPNALMHELSRRSVRAGAFVADVGQHQMWAAQSLDLRPGQSFLTSGGMGAMGFGLPAAIGAAFAQPGRPHVVLAGDGGFQLNLQELQTVARRKLPLKIVVLNNRCHGMVRQFQQSYFKERYASTVWGYSAPDFEAVARAYGLDAVTVEGPKRLGRALDALWKDPLKPALLQVMIDPLVNVYPKMAFGRPMTEMEPFAKPTAMEGT